MFAGRSGDLSGVAAASGSTPAFARGSGGKSTTSDSANVEVLRVDVCPAGKIVSLLLATPGFGVARAGTVWLNCPAVSVTQWHPFDYTAFSCGDDDAAAHQQTVLSVHIKAYNRYVCVCVAGNGSAGGLTQEAWQQTEVERVVCTDRISTFDPVCTGGPSS